MGYCDELILRRRSRTVTRAMCMRFAREIYTSISKDRVTVRTFNTFPGDKSNERYGDTRYLET